MASKRIVLKFPHRLLDQPIVCRLVRDFNLEFNILKANVTPNEEGFLVMELRGKDTDFESGIEYLKKSGVVVQPLSQDIQRNEIRCTNCGACVAICPTAALVLDHESRKVIFHNDKCIACELCINACPVRAMEVHF